MSLLERFKFSIKAPQPQAVRRRSRIEFLASDVDEPELARYAAGDVREEMIQRKALSLPAVFTSAMNVAKMASAHLPEVVRQLGPDEEATPIRGHEFEAVLRRPNPWMSTTFLLWFTYFALPIRGNAYWYLADDEDGNLAQIWPIPPMRVTPVASKDTEEFISHYNYAVRRGGEPIRLPTSNVLWMRQPNIFDLFDGMSSIAPLAANVETADNQRKFRANFFGPKRAMPGVSFGIRKDVGKSEFERLKHEILTELSALDRAALVHRAGDMSVETFGMTVEDLNIVQLDDADAKVFKEVLGWSEALGARETTYASAYAAQDLVAEYTVWPYMKLVSGDITAQIIAPRYGEELLCRYKDIRQGRRDVERADYQVYSPDRTINENRKAKGLEPVGGEYAEICKTVPVRILPFHFQQGEAEPEEETPEAMPAELSADLDRWERKALRWLKEGKPPTPSFASEYIPDEFHDAILDCLYVAQTAGDVREVFSEAKAGKKKRPRPGLVGSA